MKVVRIQKIVIKVNQKVILNQKVQKIQKVQKAQKAQKAKSQGKTVSKTIPLSTIKEMEKINPQKAIKEYEKYVAEKSDKDAPYKRLAIIYRKLRQEENEIRVIETAIEVLSEEKPQKATWFINRLEKMK